MYMGNAVFVCFTAALIIFIGSICGIVALIKIRKLAEKYVILEKQVENLRPHAIQPQESVSPDIDEPITLEELSSLEKSPPAFQEDEQRTSLSEDATVPEPSMEKELPPPPPPSQSPNALEMKLGTRWLNWVGIVMLVIGIGFFMKYAYDNAWIGPKGRLAMGILFGIASLIVGEYFRRRNFKISFQVLSGGGIAALYLCVYFSFQVYHFADQTVSMALAVLITLLAVVMAVAHDAKAIAVLALIGGFLSPVLLSTGTNHPYALFTYIAILDLVGMGTAYFRRWNLVELICFIGTAIIYQGWYAKFHGQGQMTPALIYISVFYAMFLLIPTLYGLVRRLSHSKESITLLSANAVFSFYCYYQILFPEFRYALGFVVLGQAILVFLLFKLWISRVGKENRTASSFLILALGLVTIAIPIQLKLYGIPIAWGMEGAVLTILGIRYWERICRIAGTVALILATAGLVIRLPLHTVYFTPVFNIPFGSWLFVTAMATVAAFFLYKNKSEWDKRDNIQGKVVILLAFSLFCALLSLETLLFWSIDQRVHFFRTYQNSSLIVLWTCISIIVTYSLYRIKALPWMPLSWTCLGITAAILLMGLPWYRVNSSLFMLNATFLPKALFVITLWWCSRMSYRHGLRLPGDIQSLAGHGILALLFAFECPRWGHYSRLITAKMGISLISAVWAVQAFLAIWIGLAKQNRFLRYLGFSLFILTVGKTLLIDMGELEKVYRIVSFVASGLLLVTAGYFYQRYSSTLLEQTKEGEYK